MDSSDQRRKRKRFARTQYPAKYYLRSLVFFFSFLAFFYLLNFRFFSLHSYNFHPILVISKLSLLSSSSSGHSVRSYVSDEDDLRIEDRVFFPDHVLLLGSSRNRKKWIENRKEFECVYRFDLDGIKRRRSILSMDEYDEFGLIFRCPLPESGKNYTGVVSLAWYGRSVAELGGGGKWWNSNGTASSWENVAYAATLDGGTAVLFVKGLNLRQERESDPSYFSCHFGLLGEKDDGFGLTTRAITAAQEVVRCALPLSIRKNPNMAKGVSIAVGVTPPHVHGRSRKPALVPSVARIMNSDSELENKKRKDKYELCVCTMVWNQASFLREWITYHTWLGVERWFIYDNNSDDDIKETIQELELEEYKITRHLWPWIKTQEAGFSHCALRARDECTWVSFMDVDEYFYFPVPTPRRLKNRRFGFPGKNSLRSLVANFSSTTIAEIRTACHSFGPSGLDAPPSEGVTVGYTCRLQSPERHKSIVRPAALDITLLNVVHHFHLKRGFRYLNLPQSIAVINHYKYQVWEVFRAKFYRRVATYVVDWQESQNEGSKDRAPGLGTEAIEPPNWRLQFCNVWDTGLRDFIRTNLADPATGNLPWKLGPLQPHLPM